MHASLRTGVAEMVRAALLADDLDATVRALALARIESRLLVCAQAELGDHVCAVTLDAPEGAVHIDGTRDDDDATSRLTARIEKELVMQLAATVGEARIAVKRGERAQPRAPTARAPAAAETSWPAVVEALVAVVEAQQRRLDALEDALTRGAAALRDGRDTAAELQRIAAIVTALRREER